MDFEKIDAVAADIIEKTGKNDIITSLTVKS